MKLRVANSAGEFLTIQGFGGENLCEIENLGDPSLDEKILLRWIFRKWDEGVWTESS
jgi:hypothetical protein